MIATTINNVFNLITVLFTLNVITIALKMVEKFCLKSVCEINGIPHWTEQRLRKSIWLQTDRRVVSHLIKIVDEMFSFTSVHPVGISYFYGKCHCRACACVFVQFLRYFFLSSVPSFRFTVVVTLRVEREKKRLSWIYVCKACTGCLMSLCME